MVLFSLNRSETKLIKKYHQDSFWRKPKLCDNFDVVDYI